MNATALGMTSHDASPQRELKSTAEAIADPRTWLREHGDALYRYAIMRVRNAATAEELVQDSLLAALEAQERFDARSSERTWLIAILRRKIVDHFRRKRNIQALPEMPEDPLDGLFDEDGRWRTGIAGWSIDPQRSVADVEFHQAIRTCIEQLPAGLADAFVLRELEELESEEICKVLRISASNLWTRLHRARMLLRRCLEIKWLGEEEWK